MNGSIFSLNIGSGPIYLGKQVTVLDSNELPISKPGSHSLPAIAHQVNKTLLDNYLVFENIHGNVTVLKRNHIDNTTINDDIPWTDISSTFFSSATNSTFGVPFAYYLVEGSETNATSDNNYLLQVRFFDPNGSREQNLVSSNYLSTNFSLQTCAFISLLLW